MEDKVDHLLGEFTYHRVSSRDGETSSMARKHFWASCVRMRAAAAVSLVLFAFVSLAFAGILFGIQARPVPGARLMEKQLWTAVHPAQGRALPAAKAALVAFAHDNATGGLAYHWDDFVHWKQAMQTYYTEDFIYDFAMPNGLYHGLTEWFHGEYSKWHVSFPNPNWAGDGIIFAGDETQVTIVGYGLVDFVADFYGIPAPKRHPPAKLLVVDLDFYIVNAEGKIQWNGCIVDSYGIMVQSGHRLLPAPHLPEGLLYPPRSMAGLPAPMSSYVDANVTQQSLALVRRALEADWIDGGQQLTAWSDDLAFYGPWGIGMARGKQQLRDFFLAPLLAAFSNRSFAVDSMLCEGTICGMYGYFRGMHVAPWLGQPPASMLNRVSIRISLHFNIDESTWKILDAYCLLDIPGAMKQMGRDLFAELKSSSHVV